MEKRISSSKSETLYAPRFEACQAQRFRPRHQPGAWGSGGDALYFTKADLDALKRLIELFHIVVRQHQKNVGIIKFAIAPLAGFHLVKCDSHLFNDRFRSEEHTSELQSLMRISY